MGAIAISILGRLPPAFDVELAEKKYPVSYSECMNTVLTQELQRFNRLTNVIRTTLIDIGKAIEGLVVMSAQLEQIFTFIYNGKVPLFWKKVSYPSLKPLASYVNDLLNRLSIFQNWLSNGSPPVFNISFFFFTQSFMTGALQNYARRMHFPIDTIGFNFFAMKKDDPLCATKPEDGAYVIGIYLEGAKWNYSTGLLDDSEPKVCSFIYLTITHTSNVCYRI